MSNEKFRLVTRSDFDGLVCAVLLKNMSLIDDILFVHPKDMQDGKVDVTSRDITTNLPYVPEAHLAFDHHESEMTRVEGTFHNHIIDPDAASAARVVYDYYGGKVGFPKIDEALMEAVDKSDSAQFTKEEVLEPTGWPLLNFLMDARTGLGRFRDFRVSNYELMMALIDYCRDHSIEQILQLPDVKERVDLYFEQQEKFIDQIKRCTTVQKNLAILDIREEGTIFAGNRFMVYALYPQSNISMHVIMGRNRENIVFAVGKSIFDKSSATDIGKLMLKYGGGGHHAAGTCQIDFDKAEGVMGELIAAINADG